jgi:DNA-binding transcriptional regulator YdaS (Cro superfamily)
MVISFEDITMSENTNNIFQKLVNHFGGQENTATALGVKQPAVSGWVRGTKNMSGIVAMRAQAATNGKFKAAELCPSLNEFKQLTA